MLPFWAGIVAQLPILRKMCEWHNDVAPDVPGKCGVERYEI